MVTHALDTIIPFKTSPTPHPPHPPLGLSAPFDDKHSRTNLQPTTPHSTPHSQKNFNTMQNYLIFYR